MEIKVRTKEQQAIDNLKAIVNSKDKIIEIEPPIEDTAQILLDIITNLEEELKYQKKAEQEYSEKHTKLMKKYKELQEENERLKEVIENLTTMTVCGDRKQIKNTAQYKLEVVQSRIEKTREFIKEKISSTKGVINDYMYHKEYNKILIELLKEDIEFYKKELNILKGDKDD